MTTGRINQVTILCPLPGLLGPRAGDLAPPLRRGGCSQLVRGEPPQGLGPRAAPPSHGERERPRHRCTERLHGPSPSRSHLVSPRRGSRLCRFRPNDPLVSPPDALPARALSTREGHPTTAEHPHGRRKRESLLPPSRSWTARTAHPADHGLRIAHSASLYSKQAPQGVAPIGDQPRSL